MLERLNTWEPYLNKDLIKPLISSRFLSECNDSIDFKCLKFFLEQHYHYSKHFTRLLCALLSNIDDNNDFRDLAGNLVEELGLTKQHEISHIVLYENMMHEYAVSKASPVFPGTKEFIDKMFHYSKSHNPIQGLAALCLGAEAIVPLVYSSVMNAFLSHQCKKETLIFFSIHIECDDAHAAIMKRILEKYLAKSPSALYIVHDVVKDVIAARVRMLDGLMIEERRKISVV